MKAKVGAHMGKRKFIGDLFGKDKGMYIFATTILLVISLFPLVNNYLVKIIVDDVITPNNMAMLVPLLSMAFGMSMLRLGLWYFSRYKNQSIAQRIAYTLRTNGYKKILSLDFRYFDTNKTGAIMTIMTADIETVQNYLSFLFPDIIQNAVFFFGALLFMMTISDWSFIALIALVMPVAAYLAIRLGREIKPRFGVVREKRAWLNTVAQENIEANRVVKAFCNEEYEEEKMEKANTEFKHAHYGLNKVWRTYMPFLSNMQVIFTIYNVVMGGILVMNGHITMGELIMFNGMVWMITGPLTMLGFYVNESANFLTSIEKLIELFQTKSAIENTPIAPKCKIEGKVEFCNVTFHYDNVDALHDVSFVAEKGQKIGIIGPTGSGKSTIIALLSRFYDIHDGRILIDRYNIKNIDVETVRNEIAVSQQDVFLFSDTVAANIAYGRAGADIDHIVAAAKAAGAHEFIDGLPQGYETVIGERGVGLSGGQKQRLTLARALLKDPAILILDDTTSALDSRTEFYIQDQLKNQFRGKTVFVIAQRVSSVRDCDLILVLSGGKIVERGKHEDLIENGGYYAGVYKTQYGEFSVGGGATHGQG